MPEGFGGTVGVEGIDAVVFRCDIEDIAEALAGDGDLGNIEGLRVDVAIDLEGEDFAKLGGIHVGRSESGFVEVCRSTCVVGLCGEDLGTELRGQTKRSGQTKRGEKDTDRASGHSRI